MSFLSRAHKSYDRGDKVRAVVTLIEGLKREPENEEALDLLLRLYGIEVDGLGLENDVIKILELQHDADDLLSVLVDNAHGCGHSRVAETLLELGEARGISYLPPTSEPDREPVDESVPEQVASAAASGSSSSGLADRADEAPGTTTEAPTGATKENDLPNIEDSPLPGELLADIDELGERSVPTDDSDDATVEDDADTGPPKSGAKAGGDSELRPEEKTARRKPRRRNVPRKKESARRPRKRFLFALVAALVLGAGAFFAYREVRHVSAVAGAEAMIATSSPENLDELSDELDALERRWRNDSAIGARVDFGRAYSAWITGEESAEIEPLGDSPWASGALAIDAARRGDLEGAIEAVTRAERLDAASVPALVARAVVEESRGRWSAAERAWSNVVQRDPDVLPAYEGRARIAWRQHDKQGLDSALGSLERRNAQHPYLVLRDLAEPIGAFDEAPEVRGGTTFLTGLGHFVAARTAYERGDVEDAAKAVYSLSKYETSGTPALQQGVVFAASYKPDDAVSAFERASMTDGMNRALRVRIQAMAPEALVGIGRPDLSERFETTLPGKTRRESAERRLPAMRRSAIEHVRESGWAVRALFAHVSAVAQRGDFERAVELYEHLESREVEPERARWEAALLRLAIEQVRSPGALEPAAEDVWRAARAFLDGNFEEVNAKTTLPVDGPLGAAARRYQISSLIASRRVPVALQLIDESRGEISAESDGLRLRAWARRGRDNRQFTTLYDRMKRADPTGARRLSDLASAVFWQGRPDEAEAYADAVLETEEGHREANWIKGLVLRQESRFNEADRYLRRSGRDWDDSSGLLVELGHVNIGLENWEEARKNFYRAFLLNRENIEAMRGLGEVYAIGSSEYGIRDLTRIREGLPGSGRFAPVRGEVLRWLSVLNGIREGNEDALGFLEASMKEVGRRPDLLVELARYHEARNERSEARKLYASALQGNTTLASAHLGLARTALEDGDESVARDHLERYLEVEPRGSGSEWARKRLEALEEEQ